MRTRTKARQRAVEAGFEAEARNVTVQDVFDRNPDVNDYAVELAILVQDNKSRIDEAINTYALDWPADRMPAVDRAIVRVALAELMFKSEVDSSVAISEALEIAGVLSTPESGKFINGLLGRVAIMRDSI